MQIALFANQAAVEQSSRPGQQTAVANYARNFVLKPTRALHQPSKQSLKTAIQNKTRQFSGQNVASIQKDDKPRTTKRYVTVKTKELHMYGCRWLYSFCLAHIVRQPKQKYATKCFAGGSVDVFS